MMAAPKESSADLMSAYLDDELDASEAEAFESFLRESPEAQEELEDLRKVVSLVSSLPTVAAPEDFYEKLSRRLRRKSLLQTDGRLFSLVILPLQVLSILVILAVAALYMMAELEQTPRAIERDPALQGVEGEPPAERSSAGVP